MKQILFVALGGAVGAVGRYLISRLAESSFPWGTLAVNVLGSLLIGLLIGLTGKNTVSPEMKLLLVTGFCGGFTTFSTFANESFGMMRSGEVMLAALYIAVSVAVGIVAVWLGLNLSAYLK